MRNQNQPLGERAANAQEAVVIEGAIRKIDDGHVNARQAISVPYPDVVARVDMEFMVGPEVVVPDYENPSEDLDLAA